MSKSSTYWVRTCGTLQPDWGGRLGPLSTSNPPYNNFFWKSDYVWLKKTIFTCDAVPYELVPNEPQQDYTTVMYESILGIFVEWSIIPFTLALFVITLGPLLVLANCLRPQRLTDFGRGFDYEVHSNVRLFLSFLSVSLFLMILYGWDAYGANGGAIERMMLEVNDLATFVTVQLGEASASLNSALTVTNTLNARCVQERHTHASKGKRRRFQGLLLGGVDKAISEAFLEPVFHGYALTKGAPVVHAAPPFVHTCAWH